MEAFDTLDAAVHASLRAWLNAGVRVSPGAVPGLYTVTVLRAAALLQRCTTQVVALDDTDYSPRLREIPDPPRLLLVRGSIAICGHHTVAIVGARQASALQSTSRAFCLTLDSSSSVAWRSSLILRPIRALYACANRPLLSLHVVRSESTQVLIARLRVKSLNPVRL